MAPSDSPALSLTDWVVLGVLAEEPRHGFAVAKELGQDAELGQLWTVRRPLVYRSIDHLLEIGLAEPRFVEPGDQGPHRTVIAVTRVGRSRLRRWLDEPVEHPRDVRATLLVKLALRTRRGDTLAPLARRQLDAFADVQRGLGRRRESTSSVAQLAISWRYQANEAIRRFLEALIRDEARAPRRS
jgi:DNA-binding PadR family transcriptional regulator